MSKQRGDTLVEVLIAVAVFSAIAVGAVNIMSQGIAAAQSSLEMSLVRNQIDNQAELLRHYHAEAMSAAEGSGSEGAREWDQIIANSSTSASNYDEVATFEDCRPNQAGGEGIAANAFFIDTATGQVVRDANRFRTPGAFARVHDGMSEMIWIEAVRNDASQDTERLPATRHYDFHIRACWDSPNPRGGVMRLGTIVRLYALSN